MGIESGVNKASARALQSSLFMSNIGKMFADMDRMESVVSDRNTRLEKLASTYMGSGMNEDETVELLVEDGFEVELARNFVFAMNGSVDGDEDNVWDFVYETVNGSIKRGSDSGNLITADTKEEAIKMAQELLDDKSSPFEIREKVIDAERLK
jgi:hypothetical protein